MIQGFLMKTLENGTLEGISKKSFDLPKFFSQELKSVIIKDFKEADKRLFTPTKSEFSSNDLKNKKDNECSAPLESEMMKEKVNIENFNSIKTQYIEELREKSPCSNTLKSVDIDRIEKVSSEDVAKKRSEFNSHRNKIIEQWEKIHDQTWPTYSEDIIGKNGTVVRHKGQRLEAHHIKPLSLGGENIGANITPMEYKDHNDHRGIHSNEGSYKKLQDYAKEMNQC